MTNYDPPTTYKHTDTSDEIDLGKIFDALKRQWLPLLILPVAVGVSAYLNSARQPPVYTATSKLMAAPLDTSNKALMGSGASATQLPQGVVTEVARSNKGVGYMQEVITQSGLPKQLKQQINRSLSDELANSAFGRIQVKSRVDNYGRGVYELTAAAETADAARVLANAASVAVRRWDINRVKEGVVHAQNNIQKQIDNIDTRLKALAPNSIEARSLTSAKGQLLLDLSQAMVLESAVTGSLTNLAAATTPSGPSAPRPTRSAILAALLTLFVTSAIIVVIDQLRRRVRVSADLLQLGLTVLGEFPKVKWDQWGPELSGKKTVLGLGKREDSDAIKNARRQQTVGQARNGDLYQSAGYSRVHLDANIEALHAASGQTGKPAIVAVTSARPGEGKSSMVASLAVAYAIAERRVLVIDMDIHLPQQHEIWSLEDAEAVLLPGSFDAQAFTVEKALANPDYAAAYRTTIGVDVLLARQKQDSSDKNGITKERVPALLGARHLPALLERWSQGYDIVLIDTPPILALSDAFMVTRHADGLVLVIESGKTKFQEVRRVLQDVKTNHTRVLGTILNKVPIDMHGYYSYDYKYGNQTKSHSHKSTDENKEYFVTPRPPKDKH